MSTLVPIPLQYEASAIMQKVGENLLDDIQMIVGDKFLVDSTGLRIAEGEIPDRKDFLQSMARLSQSGEFLVKARTTFNWALGDLILEAEKALGFHEAQLLTQEAADALGMAKHTIMESRRVASSVSLPERGKLTYTHYQILTSAKRKLSPEDYETLVAFAHDGPEVTMEIAGNVVTHKRYQGVPALREKLKELKGEPTHTPSGKPDPKPSANDFVNEELQLSHNRLMKLLSAELSDVIDIWEQESDPELRLEMIDELVP